MWRPVPGRAPMPGQGGVGRVAPRAPQWPVSYSWGLIDRPEDSGGPGQVIRRHEEAVGRTPRGTAGAHFAGPHDARSRIWLWRDRLRVVPQGWLMDRREPRGITEAHRFRRLRRFPGGSMEGCTGASLYAMRELGNDWNSSWRSMIAQSSLLFILVIDDYCRSSSTRHHRPNLRTRIVSIALIKTFEINDCLCSSTYTSCLAASHDQIFSKLGAVFACKFCSVSNSATTPRIYGEYGRVCPRHETVRTCLNYPRCGTPRENNDKTKSEE